MSQSATSIALRDALAAPSLPALCSQSFILIHSATVSRGSAPSTAPNSPSMLPPYPSEMPVTFSSVSR